jgi:hypothetical protein
MDQLILHLSSGGAERSASLAGIYSLSKKKKENHKALGTHGIGLVGFKTVLESSEQRRIFRPCLE